MDHEVPQENIEENLEIPQPQIEGPDWRDVPENPNNFEFLGNNELLVPIPGSNRPIDYFRMIFDDDLLNLIVRETNTYAEEVFCGEGVSEKSRITRWKTVTGQELLTFFGLVLHTGTIRLNRLQDYWKTHPLFDFRCFSNHMSRDRFLLIMRCLHFTTNPPQGENPADRLYKVRPIINFFNDKMSAIYKPGKQLSLDESMVLWRGRLVFRQYVKNKRHKYGIKMYMLAEPNGVVLNSIVYTGALGGASGRGHTQKVVLALLEGRFGLGHSIYMDSYYNSFELTNELGTRNTYCTGTLNVKRKTIPRSVLTHKLKRQETIARYANNILVGKWKDKRDVLYISNEHQNDMIGYVDNLQRHREKPAPIFYYNKYMGGIDRQDQMLAYYPCDRKTLRWYKKLGIHYVQLMLLNSFFLYNKYSSKDKMSLYDFRISILSSLLHIENITRVPVQKDASKHTISKILSLGSDGRIKRKRCRECSKKQKRTLTIYECKKCPKQPGFCVLECFEAAHSQT